MRGPVSSVITRYNKKSVSVLADDCQHWTVAPNFLCLASTKDSKNSGSGNVVALPRNLRNDA
jgi:predicted pyridoxine 5'-phosphate oxidase superfamily flavin-nucleotide-binding protein